MPSPDGAKRKSPVGAGLNRWCDGVGFDAAGRYASRMLPVQVRPAIVGKVAAAKRRSQRGG